MKSLILILSSVVSFFYASNLTNSISDLEINAGNSLNAFLLSYSSDFDHGHLSSEFANMSIKLQKLSNCNERELTKEIKTEYCSRNVSPYLLAQILAHLQSYKSCLKKNIPHALIIDRNAFIYDNKVDFESILNEAYKVSPGWDLLFTDVHYHIPKDGIIAAPKVSIRGKVQPTHSYLSKNLLKVNHRYGTDSFFISKSGMNKILNFYSKRWLDLPFDQALFKIPGLKIISTNRDTITNIHRCKRFDDWQRRQIEKGAANQPETVLKNCLKTGKQVIQPGSLLNVNNSNLIVQYVAMKYLAISKESKWFSRLIQSIPKEDYEEIPKISQNGTVYSGGINLASALLKSTTIEVEVVPEKSTFKEFSINNLSNLNNDQRDFLALEYVRLFPNNYIVCLFPSAIGLDDLTEKILKSEGAILYKKNVEISRSGALEFIKTIYPGEKWIGDASNNYKLGNVKAQRCFPVNQSTKSQLRVYVYSCRSLERVRKVKDRIRSLYQRGNDSVHINDTKIQAELIATTVFNNQSLKFINNRKSIDTPNFDWLFSQFQFFLSNKGVLSERCCIDSSSVLSVLGLRDCRDLDIIHDTEEKLKMPDGLDSHNSYVKYYPVSLKELVWNPTNHFYYYGVKFVSPKLVTKMKLNRRSEKDLKDAQLLQSLGI